MRNIDLCITIEDAPGDVQRGNIPQDCLSNNLQELACSSLANNIERNANINICASDQICEGTAHHTPDKNFVAQFLGWRPFPRPKGAGEYISANATDVRSSAQVVHKSLPIRGPEADMSVNSLLTKLSAQSMDVRDHQDIVLSPCDSQPS